MIIQTQTLGVLTIRILDYNYYSDGILYSAAWHGKSGKSVECCMHDVHMTLLVPFCDEFFSPVK